MASRGHRDIFAKDIEWLDALDPGVVYTRYQTDDENLNSPSIVISRFDPGSRVAPHTHLTNYFEYIIEGEQTVGKATFRAGDIRIVKSGTGYGPIEVGPAGCTVLIVFEDGSRSMMEMLPRKAN
jgi:anti-sigma factor ChrR (cupin superfamily)